MNKIKLSEGIWMKKRTFLALAVAFALAGCSTVKLDDIPVEVKSGGDVTAPGAGGGQSSVGPVVPDPAAATQAGPANVARIIFFDYDSYVIKPEFQSLIEAHSHFLKAN